MASYKPIWRDITISTGATADAPVSFDLLVGGVTVYSGKTYEDNIRIGDILADYLSAGLPMQYNRSSSLRSYPLSKYTCDYTLQKDDGTVISSGTAIYDWSFEWGNSMQRLKSDVITGRVDPRMPLLWTELCEANDTIKVTGYKMEGDFLIGDYNNDYSGATTSQEYTRQVTTAGAYDFYVNPYELQVMGWQWLVRGADGQVFKVVRPCHRYALYYVNAMGGVDFLLLEGNCTESDALSRSTFKRRRDMADDYEFSRGKYEYLNEITKSYTLRTGLLTTEEASKMHNVIESPLVYLWDNEKALMLPVVLTDTSCEYKTYKSNGKQLIQYTLGAELAQDRQRR